jgi:Protein of unknown function (DUF3795)
MGDETLAVICGLYCGDCEFLDGQCAGCSEVGGKPFWTAELEGGICPLYECCINQKELEHCGLCGELPCEKFLSLRDPSLSDEEAKRALVERQRALKRRAEVGTAAWLSERGGSRTEDRPDGT